MAIYKFGDKVGNGEWDEWGYPDCCFLCGKKFEYKEDIILWSGCVKGGKEGLPFIPSNAEDLLLVSRLGERTGGFQQGVVICWHIDCVPSFCRRILEDWEKEKIKFWDYYEEKLGGE